jgi:RHS repeat-associated protein
VDDAYFGGTMGEDLGYGWACGAARQQGALVPRETLLGFKDGGGAGTLKQAEVTSAQGYEAFGSLLPGRNYNAVDYPNSFNGMRKDDEVYGSTGNSYDFGARMYDPRVGRWLALDPQSGKYPAFSPYAFVGNKPTIAVDPNGEEIWIVVGKNIFGKPKLVRYNPEQSDEQRKKDIGKRYSGLVRNTFLMVDAIYAAHQQAGSTKMQELTAEGTPIVELHPMTYQDPTSDSGDNERTSWNYIPAFTGNDPIIPNAEAFIQVFDDAAIKLYGKDGIEKGAQSATVGLGHELGEAYFDLIMKNVEPSPDFEKHKSLIIPEFEVPVVDYMRRQYQSGDTQQSPDDRDDKVQYQSAGPFTTEPKQTTP